MFLRIMIRIVDTRQIGKTKWWWSRWKRKSLNWFNWEVWVLRKSESNDLSLAKNILRLLFFNAWIPYRALYFLYIISSQWFEYLNKLKCFQTWTLKTFWRGPGPDRGCGVLACVAHNTILKITITDGGSTAP